MSLPPKLAALILLTCALLGSLGGSAAAVARTRTARHGRPHRSAKGCAAHANRHGCRHATTRHKAASTASSITVTRAATIATVLATPCESTEATPEPGNIALVRAAVLCLINRVRAGHGEQPLAVSARLERAAEEHSSELVSADYFAHVSPGGLTPVERIRATGYIPGPSFGYVIGENLAWGTLDLSTPSSVVAAWVASPGHLANILESQYKETGIGVTPAAPSALAGGQPGATYAQEFGVLLP